MESLRLDMLQLLSLKCRADANTDFLQPAGYNLNAAGFICDKCIIPIQALLLSMAPISFLQNYFVANEHQVYVAVMSYSVPDK